MRFISITKPGIIFGNTVTACGGFFLASHLHVNLLLLLITVVGMALVIASGCVFNNVIDRDIDPLMERTQKRPIAQGLISPGIALLYGTVLGIVGLFVLYFGTNLRALSAAVLGWFVYVVLYSLALKRRSPLGTLIGGIAGAVPPVVGYLAVTNTFNFGAVLLFLILFFWQMPHFYAITIYRLKDFASAKLPVLPLQKGIPYTKFAIMVYIPIFTLAAISPAFFGYAGRFYFAGAFLLGLIWFILGIKGFKTQADRPWARKMFLFSIVNITLLSILMLV